MPIIDKIQVKPTAKKFKKVSYRPWDLQENLNNTESLKSIKGENYKNDLGETKNTVCEINPNEKVFRQLYGIQKNILIFLCNKISHEDDDYSYSFAISLGELVDYARSNRTSIYASLTRLKQKKMLSSFESKTGKGGFASYKIEKELCHYIRSKTNILLT